MAGKRAVPLNTPQKVRSYLAKVVNEMRRGEIDPNIAGKSAYICGFILKTFEMEGPTTDTRDIATGVRDALAEMEGRTRGGSE